MEIIKILAKESRPGGPGPVHEIGGAPLRARPLSRGPLGRPSTYFFLLYIPTYPENIKGDHEKLFPPP